MGEALARKREIIPELKDAYRRARDRAKDATAAITQQEKVDAMKNELAWSYVDEITHRITKGEEIVDRESKAGPKTQRELDEATVSSARRCARREGEDAC